MAAARLGERWAVASDQRRRCSRARALLLLSCCSRLPGTRGRVGRLPGAAHRSACAWHACPSHAPPPYASAMERLACRGCEVWRHLCLWTLSPAAHESPSAGAAAGLWRRACRVGQTRSRSAPGSRPSERRPQSRCAVVSKVRPRDAVAEQCAERLSAIVEQQTARSGRCATAARSQVRAEGA